MQHSMLLYIMGMCWVSFPPYIHLYVLIVNLSFGLLTQTHIEEGISGNRPNYSDVHSSGNFDLKWHASYLYWEL